LVSLRGVRREGERGGGEGEEWGRGEGKFSESEEKIPGGGGSEERERRPPLIDRGGKELSIDIFCKVKCEVLIMI
jgi:hypothetical protein